MGEYYIDGSGWDYENTKDYNEAIKWFLKAVDDKNEFSDGNAEAEYELGDCYENGNGVIEDHEEAVKWYQKAADQGNAEAEYEMGEYCGQFSPNVEVYAKSIPRDYEEAFKWYRKSAEHGNSLAVPRLIECYENGYGVAKDVKKAKYLSKLFKKDGYFLDLDNTAIQFLNQTTTSSLNF